MNAYRINTKFYLAEGVELSGEQWYRALYAWISTTPDEVLIDVADYSHVGRGPLTVLVGHNANYAVDNTDGRLGLVYSRKRPLEGDFSQRLQSVFRSAVQACRRLEEDDALEGVRFRGDEVRVTVNDRLSSPEESGAPATADSALDRQLEAMFGSSDLEVTREADSRCATTITARYNKDLGMSGLLENLDRTL
jgi:hypothetical protein